MERGRSVTGRITLVDDREVLGSAVSSGLAGADSFVVGLAVTCG